MLKVIIYEKPFFKGNCIELDSELGVLAEKENQDDDDDDDDGDADLKTGLLTTMGSIKVMGGL